MHASMPPQWRWILSVSPQTAPDAFNRKNAVGGIAMPIAQSEQRSWRMTAPRKRLRSCDNWAASAFDDLITVTQDTVIDAVGKATILIMVASFSNFAD
jgi:hypothetical protein